MYNDHVEIKIIIIIIYIYIYPSMCAHFHPHTHGTGAVTRILFRLDVVFLMTEPCIIALPLWICKYY